MRDDLSTKCLSDVVYLEKIGVRQLPPTREDIYRATSRATYQPCVSEASRDEIIETAADIINDNALKSLNPSDFVFVSLQSLVPVFADLGYDIKPVLQGDPLNLLDAFRDVIREQIGCSEPPLSGMTVEIGGQLGMVFNREWLGKLSTRSITDRVKDTANSISSTR